MVVYFDQFIKHKVSKQSKTNPYFVSLPFIFNINCYTLASIEDKVRNFEEMLLSGV